MWIDVINLKDFYKSSIGMIAQQSISRQLRIMWPNVSEQNVLCIGYGLPYLDLFRDEATRTIAAMPAAQGVLRWPQNAQNLATLVDETELPFQDLSVDRVLLIHALEYAENIHPLLREIWRILTGSGKLIVVAPNRKGLWALLEKTPFGNGQPFSQRQLSRLLRDNLFVPLKTHPALFTPPSQSKMILSSAAAWDKVGGLTFKTFSGVMLSEATKQLYATRITPIKETKGRYLPVNKETTRT